MLGNIRRQAGVTLIEILIAVTIMGILLAPAVTVTVYFYGNTLKSNLQSKLAVESQNILRSMVEELRVGSGVRSNNTINDSNAPAGGWTTSNASLVLIIATPALDTSNNFIVDSSTGDPYQNEIIYFAQSGVLYKRLLANSGATGNRFKTSCPASLATATCPADVALSDHFKDMNFVFYDQDDAVTVTLTAARSIKLQIQMEQKTYGYTISFENNIRITLRNSI